MQEKNQKPFKIKLHPLLPEDVAARITHDTLEAGGFFEEKPANIGQLMSGKGIYLGTWEPVDTSGRSLGQIFNVFAAPHDLKNNKNKNALLTYKAARWRVASIKRLLGHDGMDLIDDANLYDILKSGNYKGEWFIPPVEILYGFTRTGDRQKDSFANHADKGWFRGSFNAQTKWKEAIPGYYWSCTATTNSSFESASILQREVIKNTDDNYHTLSCRPIRLEPR